MLYTIAMTDLIDSLEKFRIRLNKSGVERTIGLKAEMGDDCRYYRKSRELFLQKDYEELKVLFLEVTEQWRLIEGKEFPNGR